MPRPTLLQLVPALSLFGAGACFTGEAALDLPCETKTDCGKEQICLMGFCSEPGAEPCGNGLVNTDEECDQGPKNADDGACTLACKLAVCGDGLVGPGEACDEGAANAPGASCTEECKLNVCGDGFHGPGEECDDGAANAPGASCTEECRVNVCGDGLHGPGEECDDGGGNAADAACTPDCTVNVCGDGHVGAGERCDSEDRDVCTADCRLIAFADDMNTDNNGWTHEVVSEPPPNMACDFGHCFEDTWIRTPDVGGLKGHPDEAAGTTYAWHSGNLSDVQGGGASRLISPEIDLRGIEGPIRLSFVHRFSFKEVDGMKVYADGSIVEVSVEGGPWQKLTLSGYIGEISNDYSNCTLTPPNPLLGELAFVGEVSSWLTTVGLLDDFAGSKIRLGFQIGSDCASYGEPFLSGDVEWFVDNVEVIAELPEA